MEQVFPGTSELNFPQFHSSAVTETKLSLIKNRLR
jgi:hypothetical protein